VASSPSSPPRSGPVRSPRDLLAGAALLALAAFALYASAPLDPGTLRAVGPGLLPRAAALGVGAAGLLLVILSLVTSGQGLGRWPLRGPVFVTLALVGFALTIRTVGLAVAGPVLVLVAGAASPESRPRELLVFAVVMTAFCVGLFRYVLGLPIPVLRLGGIVL
jgi:putative tricarboxylic transport membrane protein